MYLVHVPRGLIDGEGWIISILFQGRATMLLRAIKMAETYTVSIFYLFLSSLAWTSEQVAAFRRECIVWNIYFLKQPDVIYFVIISYI